MGNKVSCTSGSKEDREDAKADKKAKNKPLEKNNENTEVAAPEQVEVGVPVGTVEIERGEENQEEVKEEVVKVEAAGTTSSEKPSTTKETSETEGKQKEAQEEKAENTAVVENQEIPTKVKVDDAKNTTEEGITVGKAETLEIREDIVQRVTIETVQMSMTEYLEEPAAGGAGAKSKVTEEVATTIEQYDSPEDRAKARENFLLRFREGTKLHAVDFMRIWKNYDKDKSGFIEGKELTGFIKDLLEQKGQKNDKKTVADYVKIIMSTFDYNKDKKLEIGELAHLLPVEHNFLAKFPEREKCTRDDFEKVFEHYDKDKSGFVGHTELVALLRDMFQKEGPRKMPMQDMNLYADSVFEIYDTSKDGRLSKDELALILSKSK